MRKLVPLLLIFVAAMAFAADRITVKSLLADPKKYDTKEVILKGEVQKFVAKISRAKRPYFTFQLLEKGSKPVNVYGRGTIAKAPKDGDTVEIKGIYRVEKKVGDLTFTNEVEINVEKGGLTIVKPKS